MEKLRRECDSLRAAEIRALKAKKEEAKVCFCIDKNISKDRNR